MLDAFEGVEDRLDAAGLGRELAAALAELPAAELEVLLLYAWADLSYPEIATALGVPVGTVRSRLWRTRRRLRELAKTPLHKACKKANSRVRVIARLHHRTAAHWHRARGLERVRLHRRAKMLAGKLHRAKARAKVACA